MSRSRSEICKICGESQNNPVMVMMHMINEHWNAESLLLEESHTNLNCLISSSSSSNTLSVSHHQCSQPDHNKQSMAIVNSQQTNTSTSAADNDIIQPIEAALKASKMYGTSFEEAMIRLNNSRNMDALNKIHGYNAHQMGASKSRDK